MRHAACIVIYLSKEKLCQAQKPIQSSWRIIWHYLKKKKNEAVYIPAIPLIGIILAKTHILGGKNNNNVYKDVHYSIVYKGEKLELCLAIGKKDK